MLKDAHFRYPEHLRGKVLDYTKAVLWNSPALSPLVDDPKFMLGNFVQRICWEYGINPVWLLVSLQREQSLLSRPAAGTPKWAFLAATGFVGQDRPGTAKPQQLGLTNQIWRCARHSAWYGGIGITHGYRAGLFPTQARWEGNPITLQLLGHDHNKAGKYVCNTMAEYVQLLYTPHEEVLSLNESLYEAHVKPYFPME